MAELPTREELEQLYHSKGHDALVWYAWRCALRVSPALESLPFSELSTHHIYSIFQPYLCFYFWPREKVIRKPVTLIDSDYSKPSFLYVLQTINHVIALANTTDSKQIIEEAYSAANITALVHGYEANIDAALGDYKAIIDEYSIKTFFDEPQNLWNKPYSAWREKYLKFPAENKPKKIDSWQKNIINSLNKSNLNFLANDLTCLWEAKPLGDHAKNYLENWSDTITSDPLALRGVILGGRGATEKLQTVRMLLLGSGGAGKSSLRDRLLGRSVAEFQNKAATTGVEYEWLDQSVLREINPDLKLNTQLDLRLWDFGGQTIFHGLHSAFLHENCVYVLVVDSCHEQAPDNWLYQIRDLTKNNPHVLIVTNRYDHCDTKQNETRLIREFPDLLKSTNQFFYFSCHQSDEATFKDFIQKLVNQSMNSRHQVLKLAMDVQRKMKVEFKDQVFLEEERIEGLIPEHLVEKFHASVINHLDQLGYMIPVEEGETTYCLKPEWAIKHAYELVHSKALRDAEGIAPKRTLQQILKGKVGTSEVNFLIQFLRSRHLCQKLNNNQYFFPDSAPANEPDAVKELQEITEKLQLRFDLPFLPLSIHTRFIDQLFQSNNKVTIPDTGAIWRQGFILQSGDAKASVQYQWRKSGIEITMAGDVERFADMLTAFHIALNVVLKGGCLRETDVQPYVVYGGGQVYSIHSSAALAEKLREITNIDQLFPRVQ